jgi:hypothetical protein
MTPIRLAGFAGCNVSMQPRVLPPEVGAFCENQRPGRGDFRPWRVPLNVATVPSGRKAIYRFNRDTRSDVNHWFSLTTFGHFVRAFLAEDPTERTYFAAETGGLKVTDNTIALAGTPYPTASRAVGVPAPVGLPIVTQTTAGTGADETRFYIYVYVNDWGEVSAPSPVSAAVTCKPGAILDITGLSTVPGGTHGINKIRIYRTVAGTTNADFFFLREITPATSTTDDARAVGTDVLESAGPAGTLGLQWEVPPADLTCPTRMWNGMMAGISDKSVRICEPYKPYAWPPAYEVLTDDRPVALASFGSNVVILTTGTPYIMYGASPEAIDSKPAQKVMSCESRASVVSFEHGVVWASADGLAYVGASGSPKMLTEGVVTKEQWRTFSPATMVAAQFDGMYVGFYEYLGVWKGFAIDPLSPSTVFPIDVGYPACYYDQLQGFLYVLSGENIAKWDAGATFMTAQHRSKIFRVPRPSNPAVAEVIADGYPVTFKLYAGRFSVDGWSAGALKTTKTVTSRAPFWLPSGYLAEDIQIELSSASPITGVAVAGSILDLRET